MDERRKGNIYILLNVLEIAGYFLPVIPHGMSYSGVDEITGQESIEHVHWMSSLFLDMLSTSAVVLLILGLALAILALVMLIRSRKPQIPPAEQGKAITSERLFWASVVYFIVLLCLGLMKIW